MITGYGRFNHEAAVVDPLSHICYLKEDRDDGCFYRFQPHHPSTPFVGELQALKISAFDGYNTHHLTKGRKFAATWVTVDDPAPFEDNTRFQAQDKGAAIFVRGEGLWVHDGQAYFSCTTGGPIGKGQIFRYRPQGLDHGEIEVVAHSDDTYFLENPDNLTVTPWGDLYLVEDNPGVNCIRALKPSGELIYFGKNILSSSELAGVCFSPRGDTMFLNIQHDGLTIAIRGPFQDFWG